MAKLLATVFFFTLLLTVSYARFSSVDIETEETLPEFNFKPLTDSADSKTESTETLPLTDSADFKTPLPDSADFKTPLPVSAAFKTESTETFPLTVISFRPINHNFPLRHRHNCRHGRHVIKPSVGGQREISYGNDMILSSVNDLGVDPAVGGSIARPFNPRWVPVQPRIPFPMLDDEDDVNEHHHHHHHHHHHRFFRHHDHHVMGDFMRKIRKFLGQVV